MSMTYPGERDCLRGEAKHGRLPGVKLWNDPGKDNVEWVLAHGSLAWLYEETGQPESARAAYLKLLEIWKDADSDLPPLLEARRALERLSA